MENSLSFLKSCFFPPLVVSRDLVKPQFSIPSTGRTLVTIIAPILSFLDFLQPGVGLGHLACWASGEVCRLAVTAMQVTSPAPHHLWHWDLSSMASAAAASAWHFMPLVFWCIKPNALLGSPSPLRTTGKITILILGEEVYAEHRASSGTQEWGLTATVVSLASLTPVDLHCSPGACQAPMNLAPLLGCLCLWLQRTSRHVLLHNWKLSTVLCGD